MEDTNRNKQLLLETFCAVYKENSRTDKIHFCEVQRLEDASVAQGQREHNESLVDEIFDMVVKKPETNLSTIVAVANDRTLTPVMVLAGIATLPMGVFGGGHNIRAYRKLAVERPDLVLKHPRTAKVATWVYGMGHLRMIDEWEKDAISRRILKDYDENDDLNDNIRRLLATKEADDFLSHKIPAFKLLDESMRVQIPREVYALSMIVDDHNDVQGFHSKLSLVNN
jgi:hypothetical protein